jgi:hypothetical protein
LHFCYPLSHALHSFTLSCSTKLFITISLPFSFSNSLGEGRKCS